MSMAWGPGRYDTGTGKNDAGGAAGAAGAACDCSKTCCIASTETHYGNSALTAGTIEKVEQSTQPILSNRSAMRFKNPSSATTTWEVSTQSKWVYGDGTAEPIAPGETLTLSVAAGVTHYIQCPGGGGTCDYRITEVGV